MNDTQLQESGSVARRADGLATTDERATVTVKGKGVEITRSVDEPTMAAVIALLFGGTAVQYGAARSAQAHTGGTQQQPPTSSGATGSQLWESDLTLGEFLVETEARTFPQKIAATGYFMQELEDQDSFDRESIRSALVDARENLPGNFARDFSQAVSGKLIAARPGESGRFFVTNSGKRAVESRFQDLPKRRTQRRRKGSTPTSDEKNG